MPALADAEAGAVAAAPAWELDPSSLRVALVYPDFDLASSLGRLAVLQARGLVRLGVDVHCYCVPQARRVDVAGVTFHDVVPPATRAAALSGRLGYPLRRGAFALAATRALRRDRPHFDVVDVRQTSAWEHDVVTIDGVVAAMQRRWPDEAGRGSRAARARALAAPVLRPQVAVERAIQHAQFRPRRFRRVVAVTEQVRADLAEAYGVPSELVDVLPHPVDVEGLAGASRDGVRAKLGVPEGSAMLLFVGDAFERKGLYEAIEALGRTNLDEAHLVVVGRGAREPFRRAAAAAGVSGRVHFAGGTDEPAPYYAAADVFVLPTRSEPFGLVLVEAMAAGLPVLTTAVAGAAPLVREAGAGVVLPGRSVDELAAALRRLVREPALRRALGERGSRAAARFGIEAHARMLLRTYARALAAPIGGGRPQPRARHPRAYG